MMFSDSLRQLAPRLSAAALIAVCVLPGCEGCDTEVADDAGDGGDVVVVDAGRPDAGLVVTDAGAPDAGVVDAGAAEDAGIVEVDAGMSMMDAGADDEPFNWQDLFGDAGVPEELACLPGGIPEFSLEGLFELLAFHTYSGRSEDGVICGGELCDPGVPCCELCGYAECAEVPADGSPPSCPAFVRAAHCDGPEDCEDNGDANVCCYSLSGTECRTEDQCDFEFPSFLTGGGGGLFPLEPFADGGLPPPDAGATDDGADAGSDAGSDAGAPDGGVAADAGTAPTDAGMSLMDAGTVDAGDMDTEGVFADLLQSGIPVCRRTLFPYTDCDLTQGELCCTSDRIVALDIGVCLPALMCLGGAIP